MKNIEVIDGHQLVRIIKQLQAKGKRFCFILGAGASVSSGILSGRDMMIEWQENLRGRPIKYLMWLANLAQYSWDECKRVIYCHENELKNDDYFTLFDLRFAANPADGYDYLERKMEGTVPKAGYFYLASILEKTNSKLVITTNFDSLTEDALFNCYGHHPLVLGHESLARYLDRVNKRPVIAKIHRDLLMDPMNRAKEMTKLKKEWRMPLKSILKSYIPVVIGYAGGDRTLMELLESMRLEDIYWCTLRNTSPPKVAQSIIKKNNGKCVKILGFDDLMFLLAKSVANHPNPDDLKAKALDRYEEYMKSHEFYVQKYKSLYDIKSSCGKEKFNEIINNIDSTKSGQDIRSEIYHNHCIQASIYITMGDFEKALDECETAIAIDPNGVTAYNFRYSINKEKKKYDECIKDLDNIIAIKPEADWYYRRSCLYYKKNEGEKALNDITQAIDINPLKANYHYHCCRIYLDIFYNSFEALVCIDKAIQIEPMEKDYYLIRSKIHTKLGNNEKAISDLSRAKKLSKQRND